MSGAGVARGTWVGFLALLGLRVHSHLGVPFLCLPQLSFSIVSLCNHLTRSLMKKVHLRPDEDLVGKCVPSSWAEFCGSLELRDE